MSEEPTISPIKSIEGLPALNWQNWQSAIPEAVVRTTPELFRRTLDRAALYREKIKDIPVQENRMAVVLACYDSAERLPQTLRETIEQMEANNLNGEIFVILNHGGGNTRDYLIGDDREQTKTNLEQELGVEVIYGETEPTENILDPSPITPRPVRLEKALEVKTEGIRLVIIDQEKHSDNRGKVRALRDLYPLLYQQCKQSGYCPQYLLTLDDESRLRKVNTETHKVITDESTGLDHLFKLSRGGKYLVGAKLAFIPFGVDGNPSWKEEIPAMQRVISFLHGKKKYEWLPAGGTLGSFVDIISMQRSMYEHYAGIRIEDVFMTTMARAFGIKTIVDEKVVHTNRCPSAENSQDAYRQMARWMQGLKGLIEATGRGISEITIDIKTITTIVEPIIRTLRREGEIARSEIIPLLVKGLGPFLKTVREAKRLNDDFLNGRAIW